MRLEILCILVFSLTVCYAKKCKDDVCEDENFMGFGTPASKCGCCPWPCCCKCYQIGQPGPCYKLLDLSFTVDASGSIGESNWLIVKDFLTKLVGFLGSVGEHQRVSMITYSTNATLNWNLKDAESDSMANLESAIRGLNLMGRFTNTVAAMEIAVNDVFGSSQDDPKKPNVAVVMTDGKTNYRVSELASISAQLQAEATVFAVGVTKNVNEDELVTIAGDPSRVYMVEDFLALYGIIDGLQAKICPPKPEEKCFCCCTPDQFFGGGGAYYYSDYGY